VPKPYRPKPRRPGRKLLGLDLGERRVGVAVSDDTGVIASPLRIIDLRRGSLTDIADLASELRVDGIVVGLPRGMRGNEGFQAREVRSMAGELEAVVTVPVIFWDERLTTAIADRVLEAAGRSARERRDRRDAIAATVMLQSYLDANPVARESSAGD
jgi:putative Holliday junction resolvase